MTFRIEKTLGSIACFTMVSAYVYLIHRDGNAMIFGDGSAFNKITTLIVWIVAIVVFSCGGLYLLLPENPLKKLIKAVIVAFAVIGLIDSFVCAIC